jgi:hypothetical protein
LAYGTPGGKILHVAKVAIILQTAKKMTKKTGDIVTKR